MFIDELEVIDGIGVDIKTIDELEITDEFLEKIFGSDFFKED